MRLSWAMGTGKEEELLTCQRLCKLLRDAGEEGQALSPAKGVPQQVLQRIVAKFATDKADGGGVAWRLNQMRPPSLLVPLPPTLP